MIFSLRSADEFNEGTNSSRLSTCLMKMNARRFFALPKPEKHSRSNKYSHSSKVTLGDFQNATSKRKNGSQHAWENFVAVTETKLMGLGLGNAQLLMKSLIFVESDWVKNAVNKI